MKPQTQVLHKSEAPDVDFEGTWVVFCEAHGTMLGCKSRLRAENAADFPQTFCDECRDGQTNVPGAAVS
jgi:hypothetical protein